MASPVGRGLRRLALELANMCALLVGAVVVLATGAGAAIAAVPGGPVRSVVVIVCALYLNLVVHALGHFLAARLAGVPVVAIDIGGPPYLATIRLGHTRLGLGVRPRGQVRLARLPDAGRSAVIFATGPLASLLASPYLLAAQHTLAVARLRQRRFAEVEPLCADALAAISLTAGERVTVLATVAMARHALGQDARTPLHRPSR